MVSPVVHTLLLLLFPVGLTIFMLANYVAVDNSANDPNIPPPSVVNTDTFCSGMSCSDLFARIEALEAAVGTTAADACDAPFESFDFVDPDHLSGGAACAVESPNGHLGKILHQAWCDKPGGTDGVYDVGIDVQYRSNVVCLDIADSYVGTGFTFIVP